MAKTIELKYPIEDVANKTVIKSLEIGRFKIKHFEFLPDKLADIMSNETEEVDTSKIDVKKMFPIVRDLVPLIGALCGISTATAGEIDIDDMESVMNAIGEAFGEMGK